MDLPGAAPVELKTKLKSLEEQFALYDLDVSDIVQKLSNELAIFTEYHSYKDYKASDKTIIDHLLWIRFGEDIIMIKADAESVVSNIAAPLIIEPEQVIYLGTQPQEPITAFFRNHGNNTEVFFEECSFDHLDTVTGMLSRLIDSCSGFSCLIDVTDAPPIFTAAAVLLASKNKKIGVIACNTTDFLS